MMPRTILLIAMTIFTTACEGRFAPQDQPRIASSVKIRFWTSFDDGRYIQEEVNSNSKLAPDPQAIFYQNAGILIDRPASTINSVWVQQPTAPIDGVASIASFIDLIAPEARVVVTDETFSRNADGSIYVNLVGNGIWASSKTDYKIGFSADMSFE